MTEMRRAFDGIQDELDRRRYKEGDSGRLRGYDDGPVVMRLNIVQMDRPLAVVNMTMGLMVAAVLRFYIVTERIGPSFDRRAHFEKGLLSS